MPDLNLKDEEEFSSERGGGNPQRPRKTKFHRGGGGDHTNKILLVAIVVLIVLGVVLLNQFGVVNLWGTSDTRVTVDLPPLEEEVVDPLPEPREPEFTPVPDEPEETDVAPEPDPRELDEPRQVIPAGTGQFTVQVSAWRGRANAERQAQLIREAGKEAFLDETTRNGTTWYRVRIGRYQTYQEAEDAASSFQLLLEDGWWVTRINN